MLKVGDKVTVRNDRAYYIQFDFRNKIGVVNKVYRPNNYQSARFIKYGVEFESMTNPHTGKNMFWFQEEELLHIQESTSFDGFCIRHVYFDDLPLYKVPTLHSIQNIKFSGPATIVFFEDGSKVVVKCNENDEYDPEFAVMFAYLKKHLGYGSTKLQKFIGAGTDDSGKAFMAGYLACLFDWSQKGLQKWLDKWTESATTPTVSSDHTFSGFEPVTLEFTADINDGVLRQLIYSNDNNISLGRKDVAKDSIHFMHSLANGLQDLNASLRELDEAIEKLKSPKKNVKDDE